MMKDFDPKTMYERDGVVYQKESIKNYKFSDNLKFISANEYKLTLSINYDEYELEINKDDAIAIAKHFDLISYTPKENEVLKAEIVELKKALDVAAKIFPNNPMFRYGETSWVSEMQKGLELIDSCEYVEKTDKIMSDMSRNKKRGCIRITKQALDCDLTKKFISLLNVITTSHEPQYNVLNVYFSHDSLDEVVEGMPCPEYKVVARDAGICVVSDSNSKVRFIVDVGHDYLDKPEESLFDRTMREQKAAKAVNNVNR